MPRKDDILHSFLTHPLISERYAGSEPLPETVREALVSPTPIVRTIALIIEHTEMQSPVTDATLRAAIIQYLNTAAL